MSEAKQMLQERFRLTDLGRLSYFAGIDFEQGDGFVKMNRREYLTKALERFKMSNCKLRAHLLSRSLSLVVKHLVIREGTVKLLVAWFMP